MLKTSLHHSSKKIKKDEKGETGKMVGFQSLSIEKVIGSSVIYIGERNLLLCIFCMITCISNCGIPQGASM